MRTFRMYRRGDLSLTHNLDQVNPPEEVQFEGVLFSDGTVAIRWLTKRRSISVWESLEDMLAVHGHPEYQSELVWDKRDMEPVKVEPARPAPMAPTRIVEAVADFFNLTPSMLRERGREPQVAVPRQIAMYLIRQDTDCSLAQIGKELGDRDAATVHHGYGAIADRLPRDGALRAEIDFIKQRY